jgi:Fur family zinc uptake transcriptional regulator
MDYIQNAVQILKENSFKITKSRLDILDILSNSDKVLSFNDIVNNYPEKNLDNITVYRFLQILEKLHLAKKIHSLNGYISCD